jgi:hypothetical protein
MTIHAVAVSSTDPPRARAFHELLGFRFAEDGPDDYRVDVFCQSPS